MGGISIDSGFLFFQYADNMPQISFRDLFVIATETGRVAKTGKLAEPILQMRDLARWGAD